MRVGGGSTLSIADCYVKMSSDSYALKSEKADSLAIACAEVSAQTNTPNRSCIDGFRGISLTAVNASGNETWDSETRTLCSPFDGQPAQSVHIQGNLYVGRLIVDVSTTANEQTLTEACTGLKRGTLTYNRQLQQLTLDNVTLHTDGTYTIRNTAQKFLSISVQGADTISSTGSDVISTLQPLTIQGADQFSSHLVVRGAASGIYQAGQPFGYPLTIRNVDLQVEATAEGIHGEEDYSKLVFDNARVRAGRSASGQGPFKAITSFASCTMTNDDYANGAAWRKGTHNFDRNDGTTASEVIVDVPTAYYPLTINGHALNNVNCAEIAVDGIEGDGLAYYNHDSRTLYLMNISFSCPDGVAISTNEPGQVISVSGTNSIDANYGIQATGPARITGPGTLNITATHTAIIEYDSGTFTVDCATLTARGAKYGFSNQGMGTLRLVAAKGQTGTTHSFGGLHGNIKTAEFLLTDMNVSSPVCCYFDHDASLFKQNGGRTVTEELVFSQVTKRYGVNILGVDIDNCNANGVGSPYISTKDCMSFDEATKTLTLNDFKAECPGLKEVISSTCDGLRIRLKGESTLSTNADAVIKVCNPDSAGRVETIFCGDGKLNLKGYRFAVLIGARAGVTFADHVMVRGQGAIGGNSLGEQEETLTVEGNAYVGCKGTFGNPAVEQLSALTLGDSICIVEPNYGTASKLDNGYCIVDRWGTLAREVVMGIPQSLGLSIGERAVTTANHGDVFANGQFNYEPEAKTLTLTNASLDAATGIDNRQIEAMKIVLVGENTITARNSVISSAKLITINGEGTLNGTSTEGVAMKLVGADGIISGPRLNLKGKTHAIQGDKARELLRITDASTELTLTTEGPATLSGLGAMWLGPGLYVTSPVNAVFDSSYGGFTLSGLPYNGMVEISNREPSAIDGVACDAAASHPTAVYDYSGRQIENRKSVNRKLPKGFNILRMADGTVRKLLVR